MSESRIPDITLKNPELWAKKYQEIIAEGDKRVLAVIAYAFQWAEIMEEWMSMGAMPMDIMDEADTIVDGRFGASGFFFGAVANLLYHEWAYGGYVRMHYENEEFIKELEVDRYFRSIGMFKYVR